MRMRTCKRGSGYHVITMLKIVYLSHGFIYNRRHRYSITTTRFPAGHCRQKEACGEPGKS